MDSIEAKAGASLKVDDCVSSLATARSDSFRQEITSSGLPIADMHRRPSNKTLPLARGEMLVIGRLPRGAKLGSDTHLRDPSDTENLNEAFLDECALLARVR
jgi:hypothetical protein